MIDLPPAVRLADMIEIEQLSPKAHRICLIGEFHHADAKAITDFARESVGSGDARSVLIDLTSLADFSFAAMGEELAHLYPLLQWVYSLDRIAVVADEEWMRTAARLESALLPGVVYQVYDDDEAEAAKAWVLEESDMPHSGAFHELDIGNPRIAAFEVTGRLDLPESLRGIEMVRTRLEHPDCSRLLMVIKRWHGFEADVMFNREVMSAKFSMIDDIDRYAIVGGPEWLRNLTGIVSAAVKTEIKAFDLDDKDDAIAWLLD